jgi:L,D-peptidoglycan transpeptidase YkuD (ErfK/YbiS/YcfS/YnhG family)
MLPPDVPGAEQVVVVAAQGSRAQVTAFARQCPGTVVPDTPMGGRIGTTPGECGPWRMAIGPVRGFIGRNGLVPAATRRQGTATTPAGTFRIVSAFGRAPDPGTALPFRRIDQNDVWMYDPRRPRTYNRIVDGGRGLGERLWDYRARYRYALVVDYNLPPRPDVRRGGGIFLHVSIGRPTAGCVAVPRATMRALLRWLDPAADPRIIIGR